MLLKPDEIVRAQELQRRLEDAQRTLDTAAREFSLELARAGIGLREDAISWKELMASGARIAVTILQQARQVQEQMTANEPAVFGRDYWREEDRPASGLKKDIGRTTRATSTGDVERDAALDKLRGNLGNRTLIDQAQEASRRMSDGLRPDQSKPIISTRSKGGAASPSEISAIETFVGSLEKSAAALRAEADAYGRSNVERRIAIELAKAEEIAKQNSVKLTEQQTQRIREAATAAAEQRDRLDELRDKQELLRSSAGDVFHGLYNDAKNGASGLDLLNNALGRVLDRIAGAQIDGLVDALLGKNGTSGALSGLLGGGNPFSFVTSLIGGATGSGGGGFDAVNAGAVGSFEWLHEGGIAGAGSSTRTFPLSVLQGAPRFHKGNLGLGPDEIPAILQRGEPVLSRRTAKNLSNAIGTLSGMQGGGGETTVNVHPPAGTAPQVTKRRGSSGPTVDVMIQSVMGNDLAANGPLAQMLQDTYGLNRMAGKQS